MLEGTGGTGGLEERLSALECCALPPEGEAAFLSQTGPTPSGHDDLRRFVRFNFRRKALLSPLSGLPNLCRPDTTVCVYVRDISKQGVGFLYREQLFPGEKCRFFLPELGTRHLEICTCRRLGPACYLIGSCFCTASEPPPATGGAC